MTPAWAGQPQSAPPGSAWGPPPSSSSWGATSTGWHQHASGPPWVPSQQVRARSGSQAWLFIAVPAAVVVLAAVVIGIVLLGSRKSPDAASAQNSTQTDSTRTADAGAGVLGGAQAGTGQASVTGPLDGYASASAPATSADSVDGAGTTTSYEASHMLDRDPTTAWRMDGDGTGEVLTFALDGARSITTLGLINGYAKTDPVTGEDRYAQNRRILAVTWSVGGRTIEQDLVDGTGQVQAVTFPAVTASTIRLRIDAVTAPGEAQYDHTVISDVLIAN